MMFGSWNHEEILRQQLVDLPTSPVSYSRFTLGNLKNIFFNNIIHKSFWLFKLSQNKTNSNVTVQLSCLSTVSWIVLSRRVADTIAAVSNTQHKDEFVFHQDSAPAHRARDTVEFIIPDMWPGNSRDRNSVDYWISSMMQKRISSTNPRYGRVAAAACWHGLNFSTAWWTMRLISGEKDGKRVSIHMVVTLNTCSDDACLAFKLPHNTTVFFHSHQCHTTQLAFSEPPTIEGKRYTFHQTTEFCILQGSAVTFSRYDGQVHSHGYSSFCWEIT